MALTDEQKRQTEGAIRREVARGAMSTEQAEEYRQRLGITPDGPRGTVTATDLEIARKLAVDGGESELEFWRRYEREGEAALDREKIGERRDWLQRVADDRARQEFDRSPEARRLQAARLADQQAMRAADAERARLLLASEDTYPTSDIEKLSDDEAIVAAGFESTLDPATDIPANIAAAESDTGGEAA